ncbi:MAG: hypothetical protein AB1832_04400 [Pseudomonadota bacterium]
MARFLFAIAALAPLVALHATGAPLPADYRALDTNHDGRLSRNELPRNCLLARHFKTYDANHDGALEGRELTLAEQQLHRQIDPRPVESQAQYHGLGPGLAPPVGYINNGNGA